MATGKTPAQSAGGKAPPPKRGPRQKLEVRKYADLKQLHDILLRLSRGYTFTCVAATELIATAPEELVEAWLGFDQKELSDAVAIGCEELRKANFLRLISNADEEARYALA